MKENLNQNNLDDQDKRIFDLMENIRLQQIFDVDTNRERIKRRIRKEKIVRVSFTWIRNIAAVLLLPLLILSGYFYKQNTFLTSIPINQLELVTTPGIRTKVLLADGSEVWLNSGSKLSYPERFIGDKRQVSLQGEAYFKVKSDKEHPFEVNTSDGIIVRALGTEFNVEAYENEQEISATLVTGCIDVRHTSSNKSMFAEPGNKITYSRMKKDMVLKDANLLVETGWKDGKIVFRRAPITEVVKILSRKFNVDIELKGSEIFDYSYSATFTTESLSEILSLLGRSAPITWEEIGPVRLTTDLSYSKRKIIITSD